MEHAFEPLAVEARIVGAGGLLVGEARVRDVVGDPFVGGGHAVRFQACLDLRVLGRLTGLGVEDSLLIRLLGQRVAESERRDAPQGDADQGEEHGHADHPARRDPLQLGNDEPDHQPTSPLASVRAK